MTYVHAIRHWRIWQDITVNGTNVTEDDIVGRNAVGGYEEEVIRRRRRVNISYFALRHELQAWKMGVDERGRRHDCRRKARVLINQALVSGLKIMTPKGENLN